MAYSESLAGRVRDVVMRRKGVALKKMFGGIGYLLNGNMLVGVWKDSLIVRVGPEGYDEALARPHVREFDVTGRAMKGWVVVEPEGIDEDRDLLAWIERAWDFVAGLSAK
jgi:TfoX/Sxy family transcriptional regulator of competence genes